MSWQRVRPLALGVPRRGDEVLVAELRDPSSGPCYRPIGGGVEFGELSAEALVREFAEELGHEVAIESYLGVAENVFEFDGTPGHEVAFVYEVAFDDERLYRRERFEGEEEHGGTYAAAWHALDALVASDVPLYPDGLHALVRGETAHAVSRHG